MCEAGLLFEVVRVNFDEVPPLLWDLVLGEDRVDRARIDACAAVDALVRIDVVHVRRVVGVNAVDRAHLDAGCVFDPYARLNDDVSHVPEGYHAPYMPESEPKPRPLESVPAGSGQGWKAVLKNGKSVVVHEIPIAPAAAAAAAPRLQRLAEHPHPSLSPILAWGTDANGVWVAVEPNEGTPLSAVLARGRFTPHAAAALGTQVLSGIAALHEAGVAMGGFDAAAVRLTSNGAVRIAEPERPARGRALVRHGDLRRVRRRPCGGAGPARPPARPGGDDALDGERRHGTGRGPRPGRAARDGGANARARPPAGGPERDRPARGRPGDACDRPLRARAAPARRGDPRAPSGLLRASGASGGDVLGPPGDAAATDRDLLAQRLRAGSTRAGAHACPRAPRSGVAAAARTLGNGARGRRSGAGTRRAGSAGARSGFRLRLEPPGAGFHAASGTRACSHPRSGTGAGAGARARAGCLPGRRIGLPARAHPRSSRGAGPAARAGQAHLDAARDRPVDAGPRSRHPRLQLGVDGRGEI